ncbi:NAPDH-dependent diflavin reductase [Serendipita sp. 399]|nr:NAPDH-dependent diflavin reductase [Serendipita sp. 399]
MENSPSSDQLSRHLLILYASETGNSYDAAERIAKEAHRRHFSSTVVSMDAYDASSLIDEPLVIFVLSTTGSGEEPRPMKDLWRTHLLRSDLPNDLFDEMEFTVFGLGDSAYERFCWASKKLVRRLLSLGAKLFVEACHADEQERFGYETALMPWMEKLFNGLLEMMPLPEGLEILPASQLPSPSAILTFVQDDVPRPLLPVEPVTQYHEASLLSNKRITADGWYQDVRHLQFYFTDPVTWNPGDIAVLHPHTHPDDVQALLERFGWTDRADIPLRVSRNSATGNAIPSHLLDHPTTLREIFTSVLDSSCVPRKSFFEWLVHFTSDSLEKEKFEEFTSLSEEGQDDLYQYTHRVRRTILEVLQDFRHVSIPLEYIFDIFPLIRPRQFSIASSSRYPTAPIVNEPTAAEEGQPALEDEKKKDKDNDKGVYLDLCVAIVNYRTKLKAPRRGLCTTWLSNLQPKPAVHDRENGSLAERVETSSEDTNGKEEEKKVEPCRIRVGIRRGAIRLPPRLLALPSSSSIKGDATPGVKGEDGDTQKGKDLGAGSTPIICVGPGTGIAPMRAIIQERIVRGEKENTLYFGCRSSRQDYYYSREWETHAQAGDLAFSVAFSRDQEKKVYVQDLIEQDSARIWELVGRQKAWVYISGSSNKMPAAVKNAIQRAAIVEGGLSDAEAEAYVNSMEWEGRLFEECWS